MKRVLISFAIGVLVLVVAPSSAVAQTEYCKTLPQVVREALDLLPDGKSVPCDSKHIVVIRDLHKMFVDSFGPEYERNPKLKATEKRLSELLGFTFATRFPIYLNLPAEKLDALAPSNDQSGVYRLSCVLQHELVHAEKEGRETVAYQAELDCVSRYARLGMISPELAKKQISALKRDIAEFAEAERSEFASASLSQH